MDRKDIKKPNPDGLSKARTFLEHSPDLDSFFDEIEATNDRQEQLLERIRTNLADLGYRVNNVYKSEQYGPGDFNSYFEYLTECRLENISPNAQDVWELMKMQINFLQRTAAKASDEYLKLQNQNRDLKEHIKWLETKGDKNDDTSIE
jgi:hypothetical protein